MPDLTEADALLVAMDDDAHSSAEFLALDAQFHLALAAAAGNQVVIATMAGLRTSIEGYVLAGAAQLSAWSPVAARLRTEHRAIVASVRAHDAEAARRRLHDHITGYYAETFHTDAIPPPRRRADMVERHLPKPRDLAPLMQFKKPELSAEEAAAGEGADRRGPARDREAAYAEGRLRLHRGRRGGRDLAGPGPAGVRGHRVPPLDPARRLAGRHRPARCSAARSRCRSASRRPASPG